PASVGVFERDVVIIGGGHNGLACAAYLAKAGLDVLVLEKRGVVGGAAATEEPWPGYRVSSASYVVSLMPPQVVRELDLKRFGYEVSIVTPDYFVPFPDGTSLTLWGDVERDAAAIGRLSERDAVAYVAFDRYFDRVARLLKDLLFVVPPNMNLRDLPKWAATAGRFRKWSGRDLHETVRLFTMSAADFLDEWFEDERVKGALATQAIIGAWCGPMTPGSAYVLMHHWIGEVDGHAGAWGWVKGGMGGISGAMARAAEAAGAEIRTDAEVDRVAINASGRAVGVALSDGSLVRAQRVVSCAHPVTTYLSLIGEERLPGDVVRDVRRYRTRSGSVKLNVALSELPAFPAWDQEGDPHKGLVAVSPSIEYLERAWDDAKYGRMSEHPYVEVVFPTAHEPEGLAPRGKHLMLGFSQYGPYELAEGSWDQGGRDDYAARVLKALGEFAPSLESAVEHLEVLTPRDIEERFGLIGGNIMQGELTPDQLFSFRPIPGHGDYRTPVAGMYLCGSGTHPGGGVMGVPGRNAASVILRDHKRGEFVGRIKSLGR
ncbi:MAG TPA: NAD(P)/FAD-dependent oxidoreductase, partial [Actinomycetota bacterium]|nr:NAD(P)/FAD-dependent oxidoreductase [Actinomycetota bacterium]